MIDLRSDTVTQPTEGMLDTMSKAAVGDDVLGDDPTVIELQNKAANINGKHLKKLLKKFKEERDRIENETGIRPQIDNTTQMFMQKILNVWISEGKEIDEEKISGEGFFRSILKNS